MEEKKDVVETLEEIKANEAEVKEAFGEVADENAFNIKSAPAKEAPVVEAKPEEKPAEKPAEEKPAEEKPIEKPVVEAKKDELLERLKEKSPIFKELCDKKKFTNVDDAFKAYIEIEKLHNKKANLLSTYRKGLENFVTFDDEGQVTGYTDIGKKVLGLAEGKENAPAAIPTGVADILTAEQTAQLESVKDKFWEMFEKNPVEAIVRIATGVSQFNLKGQKDEVGKTFKGLEDKLAPIFEERENQKMLSLIDDVAKEQIASGDEKAQDFIDEYASDIEAELKKIDASLRKSNPKLAIQQAYLIVKDKKVQEWQKSMKEKQDAEQRKAQDLAGSGAPGGGGAEPEVDPIVQGMEDALKSRSDGSAFFGI